MYPLIVYRLTDYKHTSQAVNLEAGNNINVALSPLTLWTSLTIISEGAYDSTADQIDAVLGQPQNKNIVRDSYSKLSSFLQKVRPSPILKRKILRAKFSVIVKGHRV